MNNNQQIIKDPVYGSMSFSAEEFKFLKPFIDSPLFQRLRHIKQLSFVDLIFPGAVHTRLNHSLGVSYLCSRIYKQLYPQEMGLSEEHKLIILAGLLHDIGHGPFSHAFEHVGVFKENNIKHEDWFNFFVIELFNSVDVDNKQQIYKNLVNLFSENYSGLPWLKNVLSSQIDADRMDYMLRDSLFCGVKYGEYDLEWLLSCFALDGANNLIITKEGVGSAEQFLHARHLLHKNVYYNLKANAIAYCVIDFLDNLIQEKEVIKKTISSNKLINFIDAIQYNQGLDKSIFMRNIYNEYKMIVDFDIWQTIREITYSNNISSVCQQLARRLYHRKLPVAVGIKSSSFDFVNELLIALVKQYNLQQWQIKVIKNSVCFYSDDIQPVYVSDHLGSNHLLQDVSTTISNVSNQRDSICFLYIDYESYDHKGVQEVIKKCKSHNALLYD